MHLVVQLNLLPPQRLQARLPPSCQAPLLYLTVRFTSASFTLPLHCLIFIWQFFLVSGDFEPCKLSQIRSSSSYRFTWSSPMDTGSQGYWHCYSRLCPHFSWLVLCLFILDLMIGWSPLFRRMSQQYRCRSWHYQMLVDLHWLCRIFRYHAMPRPIALGPFLWRWSIVLHLQITQLSWPTELEVDVLCGWIQGAWISCYLAIGVYGPTPDCRPHMESPLLDYSFQRRDHRRTWLVQKNHQRCARRYP